MKAEKWRLVKMQAEREREGKIWDTIKRILRNLSWALLILKARSRLEEISRLCNFLTVLTNPLVRGLFFANILLPEQGLGFADILLPSILLRYLYFTARPERWRRKSTPPYPSHLSLSLSNFNLNPIQAAKTLKQNKERYFPLNLESKP